MTLVLSGAGFRLEPENLFNFGEPMVGMHFSYKNDFIREKNKKLKFLSHHSIKVVTIPEFALPAFVFLTHVGYEPHSLPSR